MPSGDDPLERLRSAIDQLAALDIDELVEEARVEARARVRAKLVDLMERAMLERVHDQVAPRSRSQKPVLDDAAARPVESPEQETGAALYVYGVVAGDADPEAPIMGVDASHPVELITEGSVAAVVSEVALEEFGEAPLREHLRDMDWVERVARAHETVLEAIRAQVTVIPMRMCTVYRSEPGVREMLRDEEAALWQALDHLDGRSEWGVKVFATALPDAAVVGTDHDPDAADREDDAADARGAAYMRRRRSERDRRERARAQLEEGATQIHERVCSLAADGHAMPPQRPEVSGHSGDMVLNGVYLIADGEQERFHAEVQALETEFAPLGLELELTGPWPAYNFVPGTIGAGW